MVNTYVNGNVSIPTYIKHFNIYDIGSDHNLILLSSKVRLQSNI